MIIAMNDKSVERTEWERGERETARAYEAFTAYRDLGPSRSLARGKLRLNEHFTPPPDLCPKRGREVWA
jgi:hypothetical protein